MVKGKNKKKDLILNEVERLHLEIDKVISDPKEREELKNNFSLLQQKFFFRWEGVRDLEMEERVIGIVMSKMYEVYEADNACICKNVAESVGAQLAEVLTPWNVRLGNIESILEGVADWQKSVNELHLKMDKRVGELEENVYTKHHKRLLALEEYVRPKWVVVRIGVTIIIATLLILLFHYWWAEPLHKVFIK